MGYKLITNNKSVTTYQYETELTEEQYNQYLSNPEIFIQEYENDLNWIFISETVSIPNPQYSSSIF
tara:strand:- start:116 stop:313 length:198 start_codon:yes stop_codon:yes gene_type:complete